MIPEEIAGGCPMAKIDSVSNKILIFIRKKLIKMYPNKKPLRSFHAKSLGLVEAIFKVDDKLSPDLKKGLFKEPKTYNAWIRFTNGNPHPSPDKIKGVWGMAIKVLNVQSSGYLDEDQEGKTQDIILFNSPIFVPGVTAWQFSGVKVALSRGWKQILKSIPVVLAFPRASLLFLRNRIQTPNILEEMYYSGTPYLFGERAVKWHVSPLKTITSVIPDKPRDNFLHETLARDLAEDSKNNVSFALYVQFHENDKTEPINDSSVVWKTPFHQVATISIPRQILDTPERKKRDENMSFSPGHAIHEHAPLGTVNMIRRKVYSELARERFEYP